MSSHTTIVYEERAPNVLDVLHGFWAQCKARDFLSGPWETRDRARLAGRNHEQHPDTTVGVHDAVGSGHLEGKEVNHMITAKFQVSRRSEMGWATEIELTPDYAQGRNAEWADATPAGMIRMTIKNEVAAREFTQGRAFTVTFDPE